MSTSIEFKKYLMDKLTNPEQARQYLDIALEAYQIDGDMGGFLLALRDIAEAQGGIGQLSARTKLNRQHLYRSISGQGNPRLSTLSAILEACGLRLSVTPLDDANTPKQA